MVLHRNPSIFFTLPCLVGSGIELAELATDGAKYTPTFCLSFTLAATVLLGVAVAAMLLVQVARFRYNVTPFLPALVLAFAAIVLMVALSHPSTMATEHWHSDRVAAVYRVLMSGFLPLAGLSLVAAARGAIQRLPLSRHSFGRGRLYRVDAQQAEAALGGRVALAPKSDSTKAPVAPSPQAPAPAASPAAESPYPAKPASLNFDKLYGNQELKDSLLEAGREWREKGKNGVLLFGPPGTGKTAFGEALAGELGIPFIYVTFGDMASKWVNETTERLVAIFNAAQAQQPCMLFMDEIDAVLKDRRKLSSGGAEEYERIVATFLARATALQGSKVLLVAATNYIDRLDDAAIREGRFDFKVQVPLPDAAARRHLIEIRMAAHGCTTDDASLDRLTRRWAGFNVPRIISAANTACELGRAEAGLPEVARMPAAPAVAPVKRWGKSKSDADADAAPVMAQAVALDYTHFYRALRKIQGRKGGAPEGARALSELFLDAEPAQRLREIGAQLSRVDDIERLGGTIPKGILFFGPPGTGKTATAMALARECGWSFIQRNGRDLMGQGEIEKLRSEASDLRPAIVFIDEGDDILADRTYSGVKSTTNELLTLMDGAGGMLQDVVWIAATNHPDGIDSAALRGGRFEQKVAFAPPSDETLLRMVIAWAQTHAGDIDAEPSDWAGRNFEHFRGQTPANIQAILQLANNLAVAKHIGAGAPRAITAAHVAAAANEITAK